MKTINIIIDFILTIDLREIVYAAVGAFLGFWLAIIMEKKSDKKKEIETIKNSLKNMSEELKDIKKMIAQDNSKEEIGQLFIDIPIYEAAVQSGNILIFVDKSYYSRLLKTYSQIKYLSLVEAKENTYSKQELLKIRNDTLSEIDSILQLIENEM